MRARDQASPLRADTGPRVDIVNRDVIQRAKTFHFDGHALIHRPLITKASSAISGSEKETRTISMLFLWSNINDIDRQTFCLVC